MKLNYTNYGYSSATAVGISLQKPLFHLASNVVIAVYGDPYNPNESQLIRITKIAFHSIIAAIFILPAGVSYLAGRVVHLFSETTINFNNLNLVPSPIKLAKKINKSNIEELHHKFVEIMNTEDNADQLKKVDSLGELCSMILGKGEQIDGEKLDDEEKIYPDDPVKRKLFCTQMHILLQGILKALNSGKISEDKQKDVLMELAEASMRCYPTWLEASTKLLAELTEGGTCRTKLLQHVQNYKESTILNFCQNKISGQWHELNDVRNVLGSELGLFSNDFDPYALNNSSYSAFEKKVIKWLFIHLYKDANQVVVGIQNAINMKPYDQDYYGFLLAITKKMDIKNPEDYVQEHFYTTDYQLKAEGVNLMLKNIGILK